jgi:hypothetical protein
VTAAPLLTGDGTCGWIHLSYVASAGSWPAFVSQFPRIAFGATGFFWKEGDTVVFYGDSITDHRIYTSYIEAYLLTRFPALDVRFVHSGWGGDTVAGGTGGSLEVRLQRDVIAYQPTVVTILLAMNDGR